MKHAAALFGKLNRTCYRAFEGALAQCLTRTHFEVDLDHVFWKLLENDRSDLVLLLRDAAIDPTDWREELQARLERFARGNTREPVLSRPLLQLVSDAWALASAHFGETHTRSGHLLIAALNNDRLAQFLAAESGVLRVLSIERLLQRYAEVTQGSEEVTPLTPKTTATPAARKDTASPTETAEALDQFTVDLTARARDGTLDSITGRDREIRQMIDVLMRRRQNNPILVGEAGVGKTAVVEGLACRVAQGDVPDALRNVVIRTLDLGLLQAGAGVRGEFENRLKSVIDAVKASPQPIILFIDEAHTLIGAGGAAGQNDAANLLKPALARGELRTIAATTFAEYKQYFEQDAALSRRFSEVQIDEPSIEAATQMLRQLTPMLERHHQVRIRDDALNASVTLTARYVSGRHLPDKAVSVLDTACARVALGHSDHPASLERCQRTLANLDLERQRLEREHLTGGKHDQRLAALAQERQSTETEYEQLKARWDQERSLVTEIIRLAAKLEDASLTNEERPRVQEEYDQAAGSLVAMQGETPLIQPFVTAQTVSEVISSSTGIPMGRMRGAEIGTILSLKDHLAKRVIGQDHALAAISERISVARAGLQDPRKPIGVFLLAGPSGVGKTETALALSDALYGGEQNLITINMSEYQEAHTVSNLKGAPRGYVGYGRGGVLTEAVRRRPYSVVLLDEVEKAHPDVIELFFQVFDKGVLEDGEGRRINFKNAVILLTSNAGSEKIARLCRDERSLPDLETLTAHTREALLDFRAGGNGRPGSGRPWFTPALLGRMALVPYYPLSAASLDRIVRLQLGRVQERFKAQSGADFAFDEAVVDAIKSRCTEVESGARNVEHIITKTLLPEAARLVLQRRAERTPVQRLALHLTDDGQFAYQLT